MTESKKILVIQQNQEFAKSHFSFTINLVYILAEAGHEVHLLVPLLKDEERLSDAKMERKFKVIYFQASEELRKAEKEFNKYGPQIPPAKMANGSGRGPSPGANAPRGHPGRRPTAVFAKLYLEMASDLDLMAQLRAERFDIGMAEAFMTNEWSLAVFRLLVIPRIVVTTAMAALPEFYYYLGLLGRIRRAQVPALRGTQIGDRSEAQRRERADQMWQDFTDAISKHLTDSIEINVAFQEIADRLYGRGRFPLMSELFRNCDTYLVNTQPELDFDASAQAILNAPGSSLRFVGGVNAARARQQQQNGHSRIGQAILDKLSSKRALVLFSLGTVMDTAKRMTEQQFEAILRSMGRFPDFLFVFRLSEGDHRIGEPSRRGMDNVLATDWVDQPAILADPRTVAFISHCGMNSVLEAAWNGVPLVCLPCMGDQFYNSEALASKGAALVVDFFSPEFSADILSRALAQVLGQPVNGTMGVHIQQQQQQQQSNFDPSQVRKLAEALRRKGLIADVLNAVIG